MPSNNNRTIYHYVPTAGVRADFKRFMNEFISAQTVRFEQFAEMWRRRSFSYLCAGRCSDRETREFLERAFLIAVEFFLPPYQFQVRVGGLYLLYGIYMTQPIVPKVKVRLAVSQWEDTISFQQEASDQNHLDVVYVFNKMLEEHAFQFCYTPSEMNERTLNPEREDDEMNLADEMKVEQREIDRLFNYESMEQLSYLLKHYHQMKVGMAGRKSTKPDKSLDVVQGSMVEDLVGMLQSFKESCSNIYKHGTAHGAHASVNEEAGTSTGSATGQSILDKRHAIKSRIYGDLEIHSPVKKIESDHSSPPEQIRVPKMTSWASKRKQSVKLEDNDEEEDVLEALVSPTKMRRGRGRPRKVRMESLPQKRPECGTQIDLDEVAAQQRRRSPAKRAGKLPKRQMKPPANRKRMALSKPANEASSSNGQRVKSVRFGGVVHRGEDTSGDNEEEDGSDDDLQGEQMAGERESPMKKSKVDNGSRTLQGSYSMSVVGGNVSPSKTRRNDAEQHRMNTSQSKVDNKSVNDIVKLQSSPKTAGKRVAKTKSPVEITKDSQSDGTSTCLQTKGGSQSNSESDLQSSSPGTPRRRGRPKKVKPHVQDIDPREAHERRYSTGNSSQEETEEQSSLQSPKMSSKIVPRRRGRPKKEILSPVSVTPQSKKTKVPTHKSRHFSGNSSAEEGDNKWPSLQALKQQVPRGRGRPRKIPNAHIPQSSVKTKSGGCEAMPTEIRSQKDGRDKPSPQSTEASSQAIPLSAGKKEGYLPANIIQSSKKTERPAQKSKHSPERRSDGEGRDEPSSKKFRAENVVENFKSTFTSFNFRRKLDNSEQSATVSQKPSNSKAESDGTHNKSKTMNVAKTPLANILGGKSIGQTGATKITGKKPVKFIKIVAKSKEEAEELLRSIEKQRASGNKLLSNLPSSCVKSISLESNLFSNNNVASGKALLKDRTGTDEQKESGPSTSGDKSQKDAKLSQKGKGKAKLAYFSM